MSNPSNLQDFSGSLEELNKEITSHDGLVVVKFGSTTCMPCRRVRQILPSLARDNPTVHFMNVEVNEAPEIAAAYDITSVPNTKFFKGKNEDGKPIEVTNVIGAAIPQIKEKIAANK
ncbi:Thioredoxin family protein [Histomonas meleagridis]|uniref:Thioredoxin family protein n=1 Tax=Histomonas meleagridis TaxID=135588 RepID=UPI00355A1B9C|nr:Thioredoxin family protein [Histomonas meleagridis]KAH0800267.1 Thioredoxin family protein [Histomonas meleagridis]